MGRIAYGPGGMSPIPLPKHDAYVLRSKPGSLAMFAAILRASSFVSNFAADRRPDVGELSRLRRAHSEQYDGWKNRKEFCVCCYC